MSLQSDAAKAHIEYLLRLEYDTVMGRGWRKEYRFAPPRLWRFDYAVPAILCANQGASDLNQRHGNTDARAFCFHPSFALSVIEIDGGTFQQVRTGHASGVGLRAWREKNNAAMSLGWRIWHYAPEEVIKAGRKTMADESILTRVPWL